MAAQDADTRMSESLEFDKHNYTEQDLFNVPLAPYLRGLGMFCFLTYFMLAAMPLGGAAMAMVLFGGGAAGNAAFGGAAVVFFLIGLRVVNAVTIRMRPKEYSVLNNRRLASLGIGLFISALPGLVSGGSVAESTLDGLGMTRTKMLEHGYYYYFFAIFSLVGAAVVTLGGLLVVAIQDSKNKRDVVNSLRAWQRERELPKPTWQTSWPAFIGELSKFLLSGNAGGGLFPLVGLEFVGKEIEFEGVMPPGFKGKRDERINIQMEPQTVCVRARQFSPTGESDRVIEVSVKTLTLKVMSEAIAQWRATAAGTRVKFKAWLSDTSVMAVDQAPSSGVIILTAEGATPIQGR